MLDNAFFPLLRFGANLIGGLSFGEYDVLVSCVKLWIFNTIYFIVSLTIHHPF